MKILLRTGIDWDETQSILNKVNQFHEKPNNFVKACVEGDSVVFYTVEGNEVLFAQKADVLQGWEKRFPSYVGVLDMEHHTFDFSVFSELHTHSEFSILDGANRIGDIAAKYPYSGAITDHGVLYGWVEFFQKMRDAHKHPLMGCEVYTKGIDGDEGKYHLILLAKDTIGANNLIRISSEAQEHENYGGKFPQRPLVSYEMLEHYHEGLVCLSACIGGEIPRTILADDSNKTRRVIEKFKELFGEDFYLEIQRHADPKTLEQRIKKVCKMTPAVARADALRDKDGFIDKFGKYIYQDLFYEEQERKVNDALIQYADEYGIKLVATNDAHYLNKEDASTHEALLCNQRQDTMDNIKHWYFSGSGYYIHSSEEMEEQWADMPEVLANTLEVAEKCQYEMEFGNYHLPKFEIPAPFKSEFDYLKARTYEGFHQRYDGTPEEKDPVRLERLEYELSVIEKMGYASYFLIVWDFIHFAKTHGIAVGPGRGSAAGSLVCYCLRITELDPIPYDLLFERERDCAR